MARPEIVLNHPLGHLDKSEFEGHLERQIDRHRTHEWLPPGGGSAVGGGGECVTVILVKPHVTQAPFVIFCENATSLPEGGYGKAEADCERHKPKARPLGELPR